LKNGRELNSEQDAPEEGMDAFVSKVAAAAPLPGGGSVAALAGALAAALGEMMAGLTEGREKFLSVQLIARDAHAKVAVLRDTLRALVSEDAEAYRLLLNALRMPRDTEEQRIKRTEAVQCAVRGATDTPLRTARAAFEVLECLRVLIEVGNPNARSDAAVGAQMAYASLKGAQYNVLTNIRALNDASFAGTCRAEISDLLARGQETLRQIDAIITGH